MQNSKKTISICPQCGAKFSCGIAAGDETCWCFSYPKIIPTIKNAQCLCPSCLQKFSDEHLKRSKQK